MIELLHSRDSLPTESYKKWVPIFICTLLFHTIFLLLLSKIHIFSSPTNLLPVDITPVAPETLQSIKDKAKRSFLLNPKSLPTTEKAPENARYETERNIHVPQEQRARNQQAIPRLNRITPTTPLNTPETPSLQKLGIPMQSLFRPLPQNRMPSAGLTSLSDQAINEKDLPEGEQNLLNAKESIYYSFYSRTYESIAPLWQSLTRRFTQARHLKQGEYVTILDVILDEKGEFLGTQQLQSSGIQELDRIAHDSWKRIERFPNPPEALLDKKKQLHMIWTFTVNIGNLKTFEFLPPEPIYQ